MATIRVDLHVAADDSYGYIVLPNLGNYVINPDYHRRFDYTRRGRCGPAMVVNHMEPDDLKAYFEDVRNGLVKPRYKGVTFGQSHTEAAFLAGVLKVGLEKMKKKGWKLRPVHAGVRSTWTYADLRRYARALQAELLRAARDPVNQGQAQLQWPGKHRPFREEIEAGLWP